MDHEQRIKRAIKLLKPVDEASARRDLEWAIKDVEERRRQNERLGDLYGKEGTKALDVFHASLERASAAYKNLPDGMAELLGVLMEQHNLPPLTLSDTVKVTRSMQEQRYWRRSKIDYVKLGAAANAWNLFGLLELAQPSRPKKREDVWPRLAAFLAGSTESFVHPCRQYYEQAIAPQSKDAKKPGSTSGLKKSQSHT